MLGYRDAGLGSPIGPGRNGIRTAPAFQRHGGRDPRARRRAVLIEIDFFFQKSDRKPFASKPKIPDRPAGALNRCYGVVIKAFVSSRSWLTYATLPGQRLVEYLHPRIEMHQKVQQLPLTWPPDRKSTAVPSLARGIFVQNKRQKSRNRTMRSTCLAAFAALFRNAKILDSVCRVRCVCLQ